MGRGDRIETGDDLGITDCAEDVWRIMDAVDNPLLSQRVASRVERDLKTLTGPPFIDHFKRRPRAPERSRSLNDMHDFAREAILAGIIDTTRPQTPVDRMFTGAKTNPDPVERVRRGVERIINYVVR